MKKESILDLLDIKSIRDDTYLSGAFFIGIWILCVLTGIFCTRICLSLAGFQDVFALIEFAKENKEEQTGLNLLKIITGLSNLFAYLVPSLLFCLFLYKKKWIEFLLLNERPLLKNILCTLGLVLVSYPAISYIYYYNTILIPKESVNQSVLGLEQLMLDMKTPLDLGLNFIVFGLIAGIGEEIFFRGLFQRYIIEWTKSVGIGVLITGLFFTILHFQLEGFVPRFLLSVLLSCCVIVTGNLWISIIMHTFFNSLPVFVNYFSSNMAMNVDKVTLVPISYALFSLLFTIILWITFKSVNKEYKYIKI